MICNTESCQLADALNNALLESLRTGLQNEKVSRHKWNHYSSHTAGAEAARVLTLANAGSIERAAAALDPQTIAEPPLPPKPASKRYTRMNPRLSYH